jgi:uncharacterized protein (DUF1697 family)
MLRGINVSSQKKIKMDELRALYQSLNLDNVRTYIQSGNVIFTCSFSNTIELTNTIEKKIQEIFDFSVSVIIRTNLEMKNVLENNPFFEKRKEDITKLHVTFLSDTPSETDVNSIHQLVIEPEEAYVHGKEVYLYCPNGYGKSKLSNSVLEKKLRVSATTRNWKTVNNLYELSNE